MIAAIAAVVPSAGRGTEGRAREGSNKSRHDPPRGCSSPQDSIQDMFGAKQQPATSATLYYQVTPSAAMGLGSSQVMPEHAAASTAVSNMTAMSMENEVHELTSSETRDGGDSASHMGIQRLALAADVANDGAALLQQLSPRLVQEYKDYLQLIDECIFKAMASCASIAETPSSARAITKSAIATATATLVVEDML